MRVVGRLTWLFWQRGGARQRATMLLTAAGVCFSVVLALLALSVAPAVSARGDRTAWRQPEAVPAGRATALQRSIGDRVGGREFTRVDLAPTGRGRPPAPPGLPAFPKPGEVWVSPALADLLASQPRAALGDRYPGRVAGRIGPEGLAYRDELAVVVGRAQGSLPAPIADGERWSPYEDQVVAIAGFATHGLTYLQDTYRTLAQMAGVLLVVPTLVLVGAAARLTAAEREQRLALLRLAGAPPATVVGLTAVEILGAALVGTVVGLAGYLALVPMAARIPLGGGRFPVADLRLEPVWLLATLALVPVGAALSAIAGLRRVVIGPLGVRRRLPARRPRLVRLAAVPLAWAAFGVGVTGMRDGGSNVGALLGLGAVVVTLGVVGPWITWSLGWVLTRLARRPATLLAGRRTLADPKAAYRTVSGMVLASLVAGFLFAVVPSIEAQDREPGGVEQLAFVVTPDRLPAVRAAVRTADPRSRVEVDFPDARPLQGVVRASEVARLDRIRTALVVADPDIHLMASDYPEADQLLADLRRASVIMALASLAMAVTAIAIGSAASILDQRLVLARLRLVGTPIAVLQRARRWQVLAPLVCASTGAMASGAAAGVLLMLAFGTRWDQIADPSLAGLVLLGAAAAAAGIAVVAVTRPLLVATCRMTPS